MPTFAESWRQASAARPAAAAPATFAESWRQARPPAPATEPEEEPSSFAKIWRAVRESPPVATTLALGRGTLGAVSGLAGFSRMGDEWIAEQGIPVVSQRAKEAAKAMEPVAATLDGWQRSLTSAKEQGSPLQRLRADPIGAIPKALFEAVPYMAAAATGPAGVAGVAASRAGQEYRRMTGEGVAPEKARVAASLVGTAEAILERIVPSRVLKGIDKDLIGRVISQSGMEAGTEFLQHFPVAMADLATGLREGSLTRQDFYGALEDALMGGAIGGVAGVATGRPSATGVDAEIRQRLRDRVVIGEDATAAGAKDVTESAFSRFYRHFVDKQHPVEINSEIEHAVERSRGAPMIARVPFELGIFETDERGEMVRDPATNSPVQLARPLTQILKGVNQDHLRTLLIAEQDIELSTQDKAGTQAERSMEDLKLLKRRLGSPDQALARATHLPGQSGKLGATPSTNYEERLSLLTDRLYHEGDAADD